MPLIEYTDYADAPFETARLGFFKTTGKLLKYTVERGLSGIDSVYVSTSLLCLVRDLRTMEDLELPTSS